MIIAVCDPKGIAIEAIKTILYHDKGLSDRISRIYEFWNMEQLLDASRDSSFDCIVFPNYCNSHKRGGAGRGKAGCWREGRSIFRCGGYWGKRRG